MKDQFRSLNLMFSALSIGQILFLAVILYVVWGEKSLNPPLFFDPQMILIFGTVGFLVVAYASRGLGNFFRQKAVKERQVLAQKVATYRNSLVIRWALVEGFNILILIVTFLHQDKMLLLFFGAGLILFFSLKPSATAFAQAYELNMQEENQVL